MEEHSLLETIEKWELPQRPFPWQPIQRQRLIEEALLATNVNRDAVLAYEKWAAECYLLPGVLTPFLREFTRPDSKLYGLNFKADQEGQYYAMISRFEKHLGLTDIEPEARGVMWGDNTAYSAAALSKLVDWSPEQLVDYVRNYRGSSGWVTLKSANFMIPMQDIPDRADLMLVENVQELWPNGGLILEEILRACELAGVGDEAK